MKMASQRFCLRWNNHQSNLLSVFDQLLHAETFTDVTLAVDGQYLKAHKMVLSACSPYFNALFLNHPEKHPIVILKDVPYADMKSLLDFMYRGEVSVDQERLTAFLRVAESLRIKGLTEVNDDKPTNSEPTPQPPQLQRIQPYMAQQQQQRHKSHQSSAMNSSSNSGQNSSSQQQQQHLQQQQQQQQSLLSSALASMPKRKRGRPRKLSGSDDGDYDEFDGEMGDGKMCNDSYSGNDDGSDDNQRDSGNNDDMNESRDSVSPSKKSKQQMKDIRNQQQQEDNSTSDGNDSDNDDQMDTSYMEPQLMLDEYDEPVEFKFDPNASNSPSQQQQDNAMTQQARQQAFLLAAQQKHQQQLVEAAAAAAAAGGMKMSAVVGTGPMPGTVTLLNSMVSIPKLAPIVKQNKPKINKRVKLKQNGAGPDTKPFQASDYMDIISGNFMNSANAAAQAAKLKSALSASTGSLNINSPPPKTKLNTSCNSVVEGEGEGSVRDYCTKEVHLITSTPELSQRLFGVNKNNFSNTTTTIPITTTTTAAATTTNNSNSTLISLQAPTQNTTATKTAAIEFNEALTAHLPTVLGLKIKSNLQQNTAQTVVQQQQQQQQQMQQAQLQQQVTTVPINTNPNSLLKQQLRAGLKELIDVTITNATNTTNTLSQPNAPSSNANANHLETQEACSALQSLANVAERQAQNNIQPPSANNLHHQFLLHMAANPILKSSGEFFHQQNALLMREEEHNLDLLMDQSDKSDPEMLTLADENAGLDYSTGNETGGGNQTAGSNEPLDTSANSGNNTNGGSNNTTPRAKTSGGKPIQRRRIRRKAQSSLDDQAEQLTEMSVRGLDLFRYASINEGVYQCTECAKENMQKTFKNKYSFQRHAFLYHEGKHRKVFPCPLCGKEFSRPDKMKNHMKMTHESFVAKEIQNFNPLNYLITAAGEIQASFTTTTTNAQIPSNVVSTPPSQPLLNQLQANNPALSIMINNNDNNEEGGLNLTQQQQQQQENLNDFNLPKPLKFPTDIEIKNEIVISPSPSPPPAPQTQTVGHTGTFTSNNTSTPISLAETLSMLKTSVQTTSTNAQLNSQRLEEVK